MGLIAANIFESQSVLVHSIVGAADTRYLVANSGDSELRKITWYVCNKHLLMYFIYHILKYLVKLIGLNHQL